MSKEQRKSSITNANGVINQRKLADVLGMTRPIDRKKSVSSPLEQTTKELPVVKDLSASVEALVLQSERMKEYSKQCYFVFHVLLNSGCRISEVLSIRAVDVLANGLVRIKGAKGSNDRIVNCGMATEYIMKCKKLNVAPFQDVNRKFVWSVFKKFNIELSVGSSDKKVVTHALRHVMVASAKSANVDINTTGTFIGHKNKKNTTRYGKIKG
jgi:site-specific recombinase XerD